MQRLRLSLLSILFLCGTAAAEEFDLQVYLQRPGVRAVAVEFYATWCKPCMDAMPRWKLLKDRFGKDGLRVVVIKTQDQNVKPLGWSPDAYVEDPDGVIAQQFGVGDQLPSAYLWSWNGQLLVRRGHITEVESGVERIVNETPRVTVVPGQGVSTAVVESLKERLFDTGKVQVVADEAERAELRKELIKQAQDVFADDQKKCELGKEVPPNARLKVTIADRMLTLGLIDIESGCQKQSAQVPWDVTSPQDVRRRSFDAVEALLAKLRGPFEWPGKPLAKKSAPTASPVPAAAPAKLGAPAADFVVEETEEIVAEFVSEPAGAVVMFDGRLLCQATPCSKRITSGSHEVTMALEGYDDLARSVTVSEKARKVEWKLPPNFAVVDIDTEPSGLPLTMNGKSLGTTPIRGKRLTPGAYDLLIADPCWEATGERIVVQKGETKKYRLDATARQAGLKVLAVDEQGNDLDAEVEIDGKVVGRAPKTVKLPLCSKEVKVSASGGRVWTQALKLREREVVTVEAKPKVACPEGFVMIPGGTFTMGSENDSEASGDEQPAHRVTVSGFCLARTEVTQEDWQSVMGGNPSNFEGADRPVEQVSWNDAVEYCNRRSQREGLRPVYGPDGSVDRRANGYRLPTEAEWEYAARGGLTASRYGDLDSIAWYDRNSGSQTHDVGQKRPNAYGLYDMLGNVWEWTQDWKGDYSAGSQTDPQGPASGSNRVFRGGGWFNIASNARAGYRATYGPGNRSRIVGFRPLRSLP